MFHLLYLERKERRDPPKFSEQLTDITVFEGMPSMSLRRMSHCFFCS